MQPLKAPRSHASYKEEIDRLKGELEQSRQLLVSEIEEARKEHKHYTDLERQLSEAKREIDVKQRVLDEYYGIADICNNLTNELAEAREELDIEKKISAGLQDRIGLAYDTARQEAARECYEIGNKLLRQGYVTTVISKYMYEIQAKFKLEG